MIQNEPRFNQLIAEALAQDFSGWDFSFLRGRWQEDDLSWDYRALVQEHMQGAGALLDMGTGGGEFFASLAPLPALSVATEAWPPNIPVARGRLEPLGVQVHAIDESGYLPMLADMSFDLVINRHEFYLPAEVFRILRPGGRFLTQQVGGRDAVRLNELLGIPVPAEGPAWDAKSAADDLAEAGFQIVRQEQAFPKLRFFDIGAVVFFLKIIVWQFPDFSVEKYHAQLVDIHNRIERDGYLEVGQERFLVEALRPAE